MAKLILVADVCYLSYPDGYDVGDSDKEFLAYSPAEQASALQTFAAAKEDAEIALTLNGGGTVYLLRKDGLFFVGLRDLDES